MLAVEALSRENRPIVINYGYASIFGDGAISAPSDLNNMMGI